MTFGVLTDMVKESRAIQTTDTVGTRTTTGTTDKEDEEVFEEEVPDLIKDVIQLFEDFLWIHDGKVTNKEPQPDDWANDQIIYGSQFDELVSDLVNLFDEWGLV